MWQNAAAPPSLPRLCTSFLSVASSGSIAPVRDELWQRIAIVFWFR
jgi:hypothetical protein